MVISQNVYFYSNWIEVNSQEILFHTNVHFLTQLRFRLLWIRPFGRFKISILQFHTDRLTVGWRRHIWNNGSFNPELYFALNKSIHSIAKEIVIPVNENSTFIICDGLWMDNRSWGFIYDLFLGMFLVLS